MESRAVSILALIISVCHQIDAKLNLIPRDTEVKINDSTYMNCSTSLQAEKVQWRHGNNFVHTGITQLDPYNNGRFSLEVNPLTGASNLVIRTVQPSDAGQYQCLDDEGFGEKRKAELIVLDNAPVCKPNSRDIIGPNSCGMRPDEIQLSCSTTFHGSIPPILEWIAGGDNQTIKGELLTFGPRRSEVTYTLTMNSTLDLMNASFICKTTKAVNRNYSCTCDALKIPYVFSSEIANNITMDDEVHCFANSSQSCSYRWRWFNGNNWIFLSKGHILKPKKVGWYQCEASCLMRNKSCTVKVMYVEVYSTAGTIGKTVLAWLTLFVLSIFALNGLVLCCWRKKYLLQRIIDKSVEKRQLLKIQRPRAAEILPTKYTQDPILIRTIRNRVPEKKIKDFWGLAILDTELFTVSDESPEVEVYDTTELSFSRRFSLDELVYPLDIGSCKKNKCLYIFDYRGPVQSSEILRVEPNGKLMNNWSTGEDWGYGLCITGQSNIILTVYKKSKLNEYSPGGQFIREINMAGFGIENPWHAMQLTNGHFVVCHGRFGYDLHRVCIVDADGKLRKSFGGKPGYSIGQLNSPVHLSVDGNGFVMVADKLNSRVMLLDRNLEFMGEISSKEEKHGLQRPVNVILEQTNERLFVADVAGERQILIFKF